MSQFVLCPLAIQTPPSDAFTAVPGAKAKFYLSGTSTPAAVYDESGVSLGTIVTADAFGHFPAIYLDAGIAYKLDMTDASDVSLTNYPVDPVNVELPTTAITFSGVAGENLSAGQVAYLSDGSGGTVAGRWYKADADFPYASTLPEIGMAFQAILSGASGSIVIAGRVTGLAGLVAGTTYYVSTAAGSLTATAPQNPRIVGVADTTTSIILTPNPAPRVYPEAAVMGRLSLTSGTFVTTADVTAATTLYYVPGVGGVINLYNGSVWVRDFCAQLSIAVPNAASQMYDVFCYDSNGTPTLELLAWTNDTTRATALTTQNGALVKSGDATRLYLGSFRTTTVAGQTEDSVTKRYVWNYYNRVARPMRVLESTNTWTYTTATYRQANNNTANQLDFVVGVAETLLDARVEGLVGNDMGIAVAVSIGMDSTTTPATGVIGMTTGQIATALTMPILATLQSYPAVGRHVAVWLEWSTASGTTTWAGDNNAPSTAQAGIHGTIWG